MTNQKAHYQVEWLADNKILFSKISGVFTLKEVKAWQHALYKTLECLPDNTRYKFLLNEMGYDYENEEVHHEKRKVVPLLLASCGLLLSVLPETEKNDLSKSVVPNARNLKCIAMAMCHHNAPIMESLQQQFGTPEQGYFSQDELARQWLLKIT